MREFFIYTNQSLCVSFLFCLKKQNKKKSSNKEEEEGQIVDPQLKFFMKSVSGQFAIFQNFVAEMRNELQEIKASQSASAPKVDRQTPAPKFHGGNDEDYYEHTYSYRGHITPFKGRKRKRWK